MTTEEKQQRNEKRAAAFKQLDGFTGSVQFYKYMMGCLLTEGTKHIADIAECYWFYDVIASYQGEPWAKKNHFQVWKIECDIENGSAKITCEDGNGNVLVTQDIPNTDFPVREFTVWAETNELGGKTILLPSEH